jgi:DUF2934 family protein
MPTKSQSASRAKQRATRTSAESRSNENTVTHQPDEHSQVVHARISEQAYALYEEHGREDGHALEDWLEAKKRVLNKN